LNLEKTAAETFNVLGPGKSEAIVSVIGVIPTQILTKNLKATLSVAAGNVAIDLKNDILKIAVLERHKGTGKKTVGFVQGFRIKRGAIATSINHDSHNVIVVGSSESLMAKATNRLIDIDGGIVVVSEDGQVCDLKLAIGGLMTSEAPSIVASALEKLKALAGHIGCELEEPFLQLSFLALPVIPSLKITDRGLVDVDQFKMVPVVI
jgi:adenine deaminase